jgi:hypothetical protein
MLSTAIGCCRIHWMSKTPQPPRARTALAIILILLPLVITAVVKYLPALTEHHKISSLAILHPRLIGPKAFIYLEDDVAKRLHDALAEIPGLLLRDLPPEDITEVGGDLAQAANNVGAGALIVPMLTIDAGIVQLNLQVIEAHTRRVIFNTPYQSSIENYPNMMKAAGAALNRALL